MTDNEEDRVVEQSNPTEFFATFEIHPELKALYRAADELPEPVPCTNYPDAYDIDYGEPDYWEAVRNAKSLCQSCPLIQQCLEYALEHEVWNIWGGTTAGERALMVGRKRFTPVSSPTARRRGF
jgi:hypothetical protein